MAQLQGKWIGNDAVTQEKMRLDNDTYLRGRNAGDSADINIVKVNGTDFPEFGAQPQFTGTPSVDADLVNRGYVLDVLAGLRDPKDACRFASTANIILATGTLLNIDGTVVTAGDAIDLKGSPTKAAANLLLARLHLNKHVYLGSSPQPEDMQVVINAVDEITADGYSLAASGDFFDIFRPGNDVETIWWSPADAGRKTWHTLHYNQNFPGLNDGGGWNGFTTLAEFYDLFEGDPNTNYVGDGQEERRGWVPDASTANADNLGIGYGFLIGQQYEQDGTPLNARDNVGGVPLVFTKEVEQPEYTAPADNALLESSGIRMLKYHPNEEGGDRRKHVIKYRYADAYLMKAEAMFRMGGDPTTMINDLRTIRGAASLGSVGEEEFLAERGRELYEELTRRQDLIRFGQYLRAWNLKDVSDSHVEIFPIPIADVLANPNLVQNPGY